MTQYTAINGIPWAELSDEPDIETVVKPSVEHLDSRVVPRFASVSARTTAITAPTAGQVAWVNTHGLTLYNGTWIPASGQVITIASRAAAQNIANNTPTEIIFDTTEYAPWGGHSTVTNPTRVTPMFSGWYEVHVNAGFNYGGTDNALILEVLKNGAGFLRNRIQIAVIGNSSAQFTTEVSMNGTTDYLTLRVTQLSGGAANSRTGNDAASIVTKYIGSSF